MKLTRRVACSLMLAFSASVSAQPMAGGMIDDDQKVPDLEYLIEQSQDLLPFARTETGKAYLNATEHLPKQLRRYLWVDRLFNVAYTEASYADLEDARKRSLRFRPVTELAYYMATEERPLLDVLPLDLAVHGTELADPAALAGKKILLYNPRVITQGRLLASLGAEVTVLHTQIRLKELYSQPGDVGTAEGAEGFPDGSLKLIYKDWPSEDSEDLGEDFDLIIVSNWLSRGLSLSSESPPRWNRAARPMRATESTPDELLTGFAERLAPGGRFIVYAYGPMQPRAPAHSPPTANVRMPFSDEALEESGLEIVALDMDDSQSVLYASRAIDDFDKPMLNREGVPQMTSAYTLLVKPAAE